MCGVAGAGSAAQAVEAAGTFDCDFTLVEGSGTSIPAVRPDAWVLAVGAHQPIEELTGCLGPYRIKRADLVVLTMCEPPLADAARIDRKAEEIARLNPKAKIVRTVFRPRPLGDIRDHSVYFVTTTPATMNDVLVDDLQKRLGAQVRGISFNLDDGAKLAPELEDALTSKRPDLLLIEVKGAAFEVAVPMALEHEVQVVFVANIPITVDGQDLPALIEQTAALAQKRFEARKQG
jgi:cyclic 2,3-diphosphoglycerate synthetase